MNITMNSTMNITYINVVSGIREAEVLLLDLPQLPFQALFRRAASQFSPRVSPVARSVKFDGVALPFYERKLRSTDLHHNIEQVIYHLLVLSKIVLSYW